MRPHSFLLCSSLTMVSLIISHGLVSASEVSPYLPLDHWAYTYIDILQERGAFPRLWRSAKPYERAELLEAVRDALAEGKTFTDVEREWLHLIEKELLLLMDREKNYFSAWTEGRLRAERVRMSDSTEESDADYYLGLELSAAFPHATVLHRTVIDQNLFEDPTYRGRKDIDIAAVTEDAYLMVKASKITIFAGRTRRNLGPAHESLFLSNNPASFDQIYFNIDFGRVKFSFLTARLDDMFEGRPDAGGTDENPSRTPLQRYLTMHRLDVRPFDALELGVFEAVVYGGEGRGLDFSYANPFSLYFVVENASDKQANSLLGFDAYYRLGERAGVFGQVLIDDVKISLFGKHLFYGDEVEPNEFGYLIGAEYVDPLGIMDTRVSGLYTRVTNYTYNSLNVFERYIYEDRPLGPPEGNDFDRVQLSWLYAPRPDFFLESTYSHTRAGEGNISTPFPWTFESSDMPFPSGVVETTDTIILRTRYQKGPNLFIDGRLGYERKNNFLHIEGSTADMPRFDLTLGIQWKKLM